MMQLLYPGKKPIEDILAIPALIKDNLATPPNYLFHGDNAGVLRWAIDQEIRPRIVYIDPPFATGQDFKVGEDRTSTMSSCLSDDLAYSDGLLGDPYIEFIRERLVLIRELLADDGSLYVHIDTKQVHYFKVVLDEIFGRRNFRNDITRIKCNPKNFKQKSFGNTKDVVLFYTKTDQYVWNDVKSPISKEEVVSRFNKIDKDGRRYTTIPLHAPGETKEGGSSHEWKGLKPPTGRHWRNSIEEMDQWEADGLIEWSKTGNPRKKRYAEEAIKVGKKIQDVWRFKDPQKVLYPTQKNFDMLKMIIEMSSNAGDLVLDCFGGSGSTLLAAKVLNRNWFGVDASEKAIKVIRKQLGLQPLPFPPPPCGYHIT